MTSRLGKVVLDAAELDVTIGWITGALLSVLRLMALVAFIGAPAPRDRLALSLVAIQFFLAAGFTYGVYRRRAWAAVGLITLWGVGYFYSWVVSGRALPPLALIGLLVWYGLWRGVRGTRALGRR